MSAAHDETAIEFVSMALRAKYPALYLVTHEETRVMAELAEIAKSTGYKLMLWSVASGLRMRKLDGEAVVYTDVEADMDPMGVLQYATDDKKAGEKVLIVLADYFEFAEDPVIKRKFREVVEYLRAKSRALLILSPVQKVPATWEKVVTLVDIPLPGRVEMTARLDKLKARISGGKTTKVDLTDKDSEALVNASLGLARHEFDMAIGRSLVQYKCLDARAIAVVGREKKQIVRRSGLMEFYETDQNMADVGGLDLLKSWLGKRTKAFGDEARAFGLPEPKGLLLVGVQGCGKSTVAKAASALLRIPLLRLDMGALMGGLVGESESNARKAIEVAETLSPCIVWLDEIEKGMAGLGSSGQSDGGTTARVMSTFLTWMSEKKKPVFIIATANDVTALPPELLRKGRFDEIFAIDLPTEAERAAIVGIHIRRHKRDPSKFDLPKIAAATDGFSGAELEAVVIDGLFDAFDQDRDLSDADLVKVAGSTVPLSKTASEKINALRRWAKHRARPASSYQETVATADSASAAPTVKSESEEVSDILGE